MNKKTIVIFIIIILLGVYWVYPLSKLLWQFTLSDNNISNIIVTLPDPIINKVYILPSYLSSYGNEVQTGEISRRLSLTENKYTILIVGQNFKSLDENHPDIISTVNINGKDFILPMTYDVTRQNFLIELNNVDANIFLNSQNKIVMTREGKTSNIFTLQDTDINQQLKIAQASSPEIIAAIPVGYPYNEYGSQSVDVLFLTAGWPNIKKEGVLQYPYSPERSFPCLLKIDGESYNCWNLGNTDNPNILFWAVLLNKPSHQALLTLGGVSSQVYDFDTTQFEQLGKARQMARDNYYNNLSSRDLAGGQSIFSLLGQNKDNSLSALAINIILTIIMLAIFRPWQSDAKSKWIKSFTIPVILPALVVIIFGLLNIFYGGKDFLQPLVGPLLIAVSLNNVAFPLVESFVVASVLAWAFKLLYHYEATAIAK